MRRPELAALLALWLAAACGLQLLTTRVADWFVMTDELLYERLAISIAHGRSPLPRVHGVLVPSIDQLYPLLIAPVFGAQLVPDSLHAAHFLNAFVICSACIPAYLLVRRVSGRAAAAWFAAVATLCVPWLVLSSFLLTEVATAIAEASRETGAPFDFTRRADAQSRKNSDHDAMTTGSIQIGTLRTA